jgi:hypothetical protein
LKKNKLLSIDYKNNKIINFFINEADHTFVNPAAKKELFAFTLDTISEMAMPDSGERACSS